MKGGIIVDQVLFHLCRHCVGIMDGWVPYPAWAIATRCGISLSTARRRLRELKNQGLVESTCLVLPHDEDYRLPYWGWKITDKARETEEYKAAWKQEVKICRDVFGPDMFPEEE